MAEKLNTPVIRLVNMLASPVIRLVEVSGNILESCKATSPHGREDECAKFIISDIEDAYGLREIMTIGDEYTLSFWLKSDVSGYVRTSGEGTFKTSSEWQKCVVTFESDCEDLVLSFDKEGTYYIYHIQLELGNMATDYRPANEDLDEGITTAQKIAEEAQSKARAMELVLEGFQEQLDAQVTIWYGEVAPTVSNYPAEDWEDNEDRALHKGDVYYDTVTGYAYRWNLESGVYSWRKIDDQDVVKALADAATAKDTADKKRRVFVSQPAPPYDTGDLWLNNDELYVCKVDKATGEYAEADFKKAVKYTDNTELIAFIDGDYKKALKSINDQIDKKAQTWYQEEDPSSVWTTDELRAAHVGDLWYDTVNNKSYIYVFAQPEVDPPAYTQPPAGKLATPYITITSYGWKESNGVPQEVYDKIDKKAQVFSSQPTHPYYVKDLWVQGENGDILVCIEKSTTAGFKAEHWVPASRYMGQAELQNWITQEYNPVIQEVKLQLDGKSETWCQTADPSFEWDTEAKRQLHVGDLWFNPDTKESYIYTSSGASAEPSTPADGKLAAPRIALYSWEPTFEIPEDIFEDIDGKAQIFATQPTHPYYKRDLWVEGANGDIFVCVADSTEDGFKEEHWVKASKYTDDSKAEAVEKDLADNYHDKTYINAEIEKTNKEIELRVKEVDVDGNYVISKINLDSTTAQILAKYINLKGAVTIEALDNNLGKNFTTDDKGVTQIDGGNVKTGTVTAKQINVKDLFAQEIEASGSIKGLTFISEEELEYLSGSIPNNLKFLAFLGGVSRLTASGSLISLFAGLSETDDHVKTEHSALGSRYKVESEQDGAGDYLGLHSGYDAHILDVNSFGIDFKVLPSDSADYISLFKLDKSGVYWENSKLVSRADLSRGVSGLISEATSATKDGNGDVIADTYLKKAGGTIEGDLTVEGNLSVTNREKLLTDLLGYTPSYIQVRTMATVDTWSTTHNYFYPFCGDAAPETWSTVKGSLTMDTNLVTFGDRTNVNSYGVRIGKNINMVRVHANVTFNAKDESATLVSATIYRLESNGTLVAFSQAYTRVKSGDGAYGTCTCSAIMAVQEGDFIFVGAYKGTASRDIATPYGSGRTNLIVEAIG